jgi:hypothetical protein
MDEADWLVCTDPEPMLRYLCAKASERKLRLLGVGCLRGVWSRLAGKAPREMVGVSYDNRTLPASTLEPDRLAVLADALEESGCADADILGHLRGPGPHARGCHVLDATLEKS